MSDLPFDLPGRYAVAVDARDAAALAALFTSDAEFVQPPALTRGETVVTVGAEAITAAILGGTAHLHSTHHAVHQQVVDADGDSATGQVYCLAHHLYRSRGGELRDNAIAIRYQDTYRAVNGRWAIARRELVVDFADDREVTVPGA
jgi:ketosteroid isomerase-like protein